MTQHVSYKNYENESKRIGSDRRPFSFCEIWFAKKTCGVMEEKLAKAKVNIRTPKCKMWTAMP